MKKARNILITILSFVLLLTMAFGVVACDAPGSGGGDGDQEIIVQLNKSRIDADQRTAPVQLKATVYVDGRTISNPTLEWTIIDENVATVSDNGLVTIVGMGETAVTCTYEETSSSCVVKVEKYYPPQFKLVIEQDSVEIPFVAGHTFTITPSAYFTADNAPANPVYTFRSLNETVATVDANGVVTVVSEGTCEIKVIGTIDGNTSDVVLSLTVGAGASDGSFSPDQPWQ